MGQDAFMFVAYLESVKYVGHLFPIALLRIYLGWSFLTTAWQRYQGDYLSQPRIAATITEWAPTSSAPDWYKDFLDRVVVPNWQLFAYCIVYFGFLVGISFILGFFVRPVALIAAFVTLNFIYNSQIAEKGGELPLPQDRASNFNYTPLVIAGAAAKA